MTRWSYDGRPAKSWNHPLSVERFEVQNSTPFDLQLAHFVDVARGMAQPRCSGEEGLGALVVCQAVRRSIESGQSVDVDIDLFTPSK